MKEIEVPGKVTVAVLANLASVPPGRLIRTAFEELGRLLTIDEVLLFEEARALLAYFGFIARPPRG